MEKVQQVTTKEPQQVTMQEPQQVTTKDPKKVEVGKKLAEWNHRNKKKLKAQKSEVEPMLTYGIGAILAVGV